MTAKILNTDGIYSDAVPANGKDFSLKEAQTIVGGLVTCLPLPASVGKGLILVCNEEGLILRLPLNETASQLAGRPIVGQVLICPSKMFK